ncbi:MAG: YwaF family protein [Oscillospiraceae bacterium]|nr:YwaF family protein [Oscillospiraceae bacterium]
MENFWLMGDSGGLPGHITGIAMYGPEHLLWLAAGAALWVAMALAYRRMGPENRRRTALALAWLIFALEAVRMALQGGLGVFTRHLIPLHLCGLATYLTLLHALRGAKSPAGEPPSQKNVLLGEVLYSLCLPGAVCALIFPDWVAFPILNAQSMQSFLTHIFLTAYPVMLVAGGDIRPSARRLPKCLLFIAALAAPIYILNKIIGTNFFFLNEPSPGSPLELFGMLGNPGYILGYIPIVGAAWLLLYGPPAIWRKLRDRKTAPMR